MSSGAYRLAPWTTVARPHEDVTRGALDMGTYAANLAGVFRRRPACPTSTHDPTPSSLRPT